MWGLPLRLPGVPTDRLLNTTAPSRAPHPAWPPRLLPTTQTQTSLPPLLVAIRRVRWEHRICAGLLSRRLSLEDLRTKPLSCRFGHVFAVAYLGESPRLAYSFRSCMHSHVAVYCSAFPSWVSFIVTVLVGAHAWGGHPVVQKRKVELTEVEDAVVHGVPEAAADAGSSEEPRKKKKKKVKQDAATEDGVPATSEKKKKKKAERLAMCSRNVAICKSAFLLHLPTEVVVAVADCEVHGCSET